MVEWHLYFSQPFLCRIIISIWHSTKQNLEFIILYRHLSIVENYTFTSRWFVIFFMPPPFCKGGIKCYPWQVLPSDCLSVRPSVHPQSLFTYYKLGWVGTFIHILFLLVIGLLVSWKYICILPCVIHYRFLVFFQL